MLTAAPPLSDRLAALLELFLRATGRESAKRQAVLTPGLANGIVQRVQGLSRRFAALLALWQAGRLAPAPRPLRPRAASTPRPPDSADHRMRKRAAWAAANLPPALALAMQPRSPLALSVEANAPLPASRLPRGFAWMHRLFPASAPPAAGELDSMLRNETDMQAFVAAVPQAGRIMRPLCHMLGIRPPEWLALPRRPRAPRPRPKRERPAKPIDVTKLWSVAFGNLIHPEREPMGWRPPNRIGYARARRFPKAD